MPEKPVARHEDVVREIDRAFDGATMPRTARELAPEGIEARYVIEHFLGKSQGDLEPSSFLPSLHMEDFTYMTQGAVEYYLPAVMKVMLVEPYDADLWIFLSGFLRRRSRSLRGLTPSQQSAIARWAGFLRVDWLQKEPWSRFPWDAEDLARQYRELAER